MVFERYFLDSCKSAFSKLMNDSTINDTAYFLILIGGLFLLSMLVSHLARKLKIPRVTLLILAGIGIGPAGLNWVNGLEQTWFPMISSVTLLIIGYLLGAKLTRAYFHKYGRSVSVLGTVMTLVTFTVVCGGLYALGISLELAAILAALSVATDPTATIDVIEQDNNKCSRKNSETATYKDLIRGVVALDDILGLLLFSVVLALLLAGQGESESTLIDGVLHFSYDTFGSILLGCVLGTGLTYLLNHKPHQRPVFVESLGLILLCGGLASLLNMSYLLAAMAMGAIVINFAHKTRLHLHEVEQVEQPMLILFFVLAGATLKFDGLQTVGWILFAYVVLRLIGRWFSGFLVPSKYRAYQSPNVIGLAFTSQAGVAMGMALVAGNHFPDLQNTILTVAISATVIFELIGPILTSLCLSAASKKIERTKL